MAVTNSASHPHMVVVTRLAPGKSIKDFLDWAYAPNRRPAPGEALGGATEVSSRGVGRDEEGGTGAAVLAGALSFSSQRFPK